MTTPTYGRVLPASDELTEAGGEAKVPRGHDGVVDDRVIIAP
ncbi:hypothetical protein OOK36_44435 [Streptomyces sp. NBC_00365]|nr:hypothetical protein [Streptomyces sp. NBC_00365]MCX5095755.1 hypothetical protein [Streptomyces sp. NBC_00365]